jgi:cytochrome c oxidase subunit 2
VVVAHTPADFARWKASRRPAEGADGEGLALFLSSGCAACPTIRGTPARGLAGPDLTHVGSRKTLGAGILPNNPGTMAGWVADSQAIKPANRMPAYHQYSGEELQALTAYLVALK